MASLSNLKGPAKIVGYILGGGLLLIGVGVVVTMVTMLLKFRTMASAMDDLPSVTKKTDDIVDAQSNTMRLAKRVI